jgi:rhodanese-related sulfurtransferase
MIQRYTIEAFRGVLAGGDCQVIDVREAAEFEAARLGGARLAPLSVIEEHASSIDRSRPVYLLCSSGNRAGKAADRLQALGFNDLRVIEGGLQAWMATGHPVERGQGGVWPLERQVRFMAGGLVLISALLAWLVHPAFVWLSGFIGAGLVFSAVTDTCGMAMMLAKMPWNQRSNSTNPGCAPRGV